MLPALTRPTIILFAAVLGILSSVSVPRSAHGAGPATASDETSDGDGDGVSDVQDACPDTGGQIVNDDGCAVCECESATSRRDYLKCVRTEANRRKKAGTISRQERRAFLTAANRSTCGNPDLTRCCDFTGADLTADQLVGRCKVMPVTRCETLSEDPDNDVEDFGPGGCTPNPCLE